jgi:hypothetical protein
MRELRRERRKPVKKVNDGIFIPSAKRNSFAYAASGFQKGLSRPTSGCSSVRLGSVLLVCGLPALVFLQGLLGLCSSPQLGQYMGHSSVKVTDPLLEAQGPFLKNAKFRYMRTKIRIITLYVI